MRILIIRFSSIGDIVLCSAVIRCLKQAYPESEVHFLTKDTYTSIVSTNPHISKVISLSESIFALSQKIAQEDYDVVVDLHNNLRSNLLIQLLPEKVKVLQYHKNRLKRSLSVWLKRDFFKGRHVVDQYFEALKPLNVYHDGNGLDYFIHPDDKVSRTNLPFTHLAGFAVFCLGATHFTKKWPEEKWMALCEEIPLPVILIGGKSEAEIGQKLAEQDPFKIINACGKYSLGQSASIIQQAKFVVTHDTGMMHIAAAFKKKTISIWGGTVHWLGFRPFMDDPSLNITVENEALTCRPCSKYGRKNCPKGHFKCMKDIQPEKILELTVGHIM